MDYRPLGKTGIRIAPLVLGGNVFGWTIDEKQSFAVLDAFIDHGFNAIDTADVYSRWVPGNKGGESETIIGNWLKARPGLRDKVVIITKVGSDLGVPGKKGLSARWIAEAVEDSLRRLGLETIDLYFSHWPDGTPHEETLGAYQKLLVAGKIRAIGASNYDIRLATDALESANANGLPAYQVLQPEYNLYSRTAFEGPLQDFAIDENLGVISYYALASGFLTGKYRTERDLGQSPRGSGAGRYLNERGLKILGGLDAVAANHGATPAEIALAWLMAQPGLTAPIASASTPQQVETFSRAAALQLSPGDIAVLNAASA